MQNRPEHVQKPAELMYVKCELLYRVFHNSVVNTLSFEALNIPLTLPSTGGGVILALLLNFEACRSKREAWFGPMHT